MSFIAENFGVALNSIQATSKKSFSFLRFFVCTYSTLTGHSNESLGYSFLFAASVLVPEWPKIIRTESCFVWVYERQTNSTLFLWWLLVNRRINSFMGAQEKEWPLILWKRVVGMVLFTEFPWEFSFSCNLRSSFQWILNTKWVFSVLHPLVFLLPSFYSGCISFFLLHWRLNNWLFLVDVLNMSFQCGQLLHIVFPTSCQVSARTSSKYPCQSIEQIHGYQKDS